MTKMLTSPRQRKFASDQGLVSYGMIRSMPRPQQFYRDADSMGERLVKLELKLDKDRSSVSPRLIYRESDEPRECEADWKELPLTKLRAKQPSNEEYGNLLASVVFADDLKGFWKEVRKKTPLRLLVRISTHDELDTLCWESLRDPVTHHPLAADEKLYFSRFMPIDTPLPELSPQQKMRVLLAVAPGNDIDVDKELARGAKLFAEANIPTVSLKEYGATSLPQIVKTFHEQKCNVLYLVSHGVKSEGQSVLKLEAAGHATGNVSADEFVQRWQSSKSLPAVVFLVVCHSAGDRRDGFGESLGSKLALAGVPATLAIRDRIDMQTIDLLLPTLMQKLAEDGRIDRALSAARHTLLDRIDYWQPVLILSSERHSIWLEANEVRSRLATSPGDRQQSKRYDNFIADALMVDDWQSKSDVEEAFYKELDSLLPIPIKWKDMAALRKLLPDETMDVEFYRDLLPDNRYFDQVIQNHADGMTIASLAQLLAFSSKGKDWVVTLLDRVMDRIEVQKQPAVLAWIEQQGGEIIPRASDDGNPILVVKIEPDIHSPTRKFTCAGWLCRNEKTRQLETGERAIASYEIPGVIDSLLQQCRKLQRQTKIQPIAVELIAPVPLLLQAADEWETEVAEDEFKRLSSYHHLVVRSYERHYEPSMQTHDESWKELWNKREKDARALETSIKVTDHLSGGAPIVVAKKLPTEFLRDRLRKDEQEAIRKFLETGVPIALIRKDDQDAPNITKTLTDTVKTGPLHELGRRITELRQQDDDSSLGLTLLWDDPSSRPPDWRAEFDPIA